MLDEYWRKIGRNLKMAAGGDPIISPLTCCFCIRYSTQCLKLLNFCDSTAMALSSLFTPTNIIKTLVSCVAKCGVLTINSDPVCI
jgi:hypothetical protein